MAKEMIFSSAKKTVYRDGDTAIKEFCEGFPKAEVLNEALCKSGDHRSAQCSKGFRGNGN